LRVQGWKQNELPRRCVAAKLRIARLESATWTNAVTAYLFTLARVHFGEQAPVLCATSRLLRGNDS
jgi:hypothetical protein